MPARSAWTILDLFERIEGVGSALMRNFDGRPGKYGLSQFGVISTGEVALEGKKHGLLTFALLLAPRARWSQNIPAECG
jgi:hypothetical protein